MMMMRWRRRRSAFLRSVLTFPSLHSAAGKELRLSVAVTLMQNLSDWSGHFAEILHSLHILVCFSTLSGSLQAHSLWLIIALAPPPNLFTQLLAKFLRWHDSPIKVQNLLSKTGSAVRVFGNFVVLSSSSERASVYAEIPPPSCPNVTTLPFPTIHHSVGQNKMLWQFGQRDGGIRKHCPQSL